MKSVSVLAAFKKFAKQELIHSQLVRRLNNGVIPAKNTCEELAILLTRKARNSYIRTFKI